VINSPRNLAAYRKLVDVVCSRRALAFVGAGVTRPLGYPSWAGLIQRLAEEARLLHGEQIPFNGQTVPLAEVLRNRDHLVQAQVLKDALGDAYFPVMTNLFGPRMERSASITNLIRMPFRHLLTSNYDSALEDHHGPEARPDVICLHQPALGYFTTSFHDDNYDRRIVHVHGRYDEPQRIVLTERDYVEYRSPSSTLFWSNISTTGHLVFFGFSFDDVDLLHGLRDARNILQADVRHYVVTELDDSSREEECAMTMQVKYGIEPVFFLRVGNDFRGYNTLIGRLRTDVCVRDTVYPTLAGTGGEHIHMQEIAPALALEETEPAAVLEGVERLRVITRENIRRRRTGDLE